MRDPLCSLTEPDRTVAEDVLTQSDRRESAVPPALEFVQVSCTFVAQDPRTPAYPVVAQTSLTIQAGEFVAVVGPTGCGKSTLLNVAAGLLSPSSGHVRMFGAPLDGLNPRAGYLFQTDALMPWRTALENVEAGLIFRGVPRAHARRRALVWLQRVGLNGFGGHYPHQLSGGMRKRVALAQTLILDPDLLLMDEPFSALDAQTRQLMQHELLALWGARRCAVLFVTHDLDEAIALADRVVVLAAGPETRPIAQFAVALSRPRALAELRHDPAFTVLHARIWAVLRDEVLRSVARQQAVACPIPPLASP
ncbi:mannosyltransferase [Burkholderia sp. Nafp2/4-1b]|uniref:ABC transporter ATP-binding protein n=1 Tax=Burkholderia sp. Nafp2/4-1b TaxID=2116686 RepID=UPI000EF93647|nr:ABC transporter ATP-binding protein [Burkholderia sp. Nafp2/4-1b]RKT98627.1 mannosyltransferase [Burkholderia sp. Nafp2/4-1b]